MEPTVLTYLEYLVIAIALAIWVAETLARNGLLLVLAALPDGSELALVARPNGAESALDARPQGAELARSHSHLLKVGFYLVALAYICLELEINGGVSGARGSIEALAQRLGGVALFLGLLHFCWILAYQRMRRRALADNDPPPLLDEGGVTELSLGTPPP